MVTIIRFPRFIYITQILSLKISQVNTFTIWLINFTFHILIFQHCTNEHVFPQQLHHYHLSRMLSYTVCYKKINNATVKFVVFSQQPSSQDLCVNIAHIRTKKFRCVRKYIKFVKFLFKFLLNDIRSF